MTASNALLGAIGGSSAQMLSGQCVVRPSYPFHHSHSFHESDGLSLKTLLRIRPRDWQAIRHRVVSHPHEAIPSSLTATSGSEKHSNCPSSTIATTTNSNSVYTPLHDAIQKNAPSDVIKAIIQAYPQALFMGNEFHRTPLVLACDDCLIKDGIVMALLEEQIKLSQQKHWPTFAEGSDDNFITSTSQGAKFASWLSYAFPRENGQVHSGPENERAMTFRSNIGRYVPSGGYTPSPSRRCDDGSIIQQGNDRDAPPRLPVSSSLHRFWRLLLLELRAPWVFGHSSSLFSGGELPREVHAVISAQCPVPVVGLAAHLHPSQLREENEAGDLPLHIACRQRSTSYATTYHRKGEEPQTERRGSVSCHQNKRSRCIRKLETQEHSPTTIDVLVTAYPEAASIPARDGSMPLNMALAAGNTWRRGGVMSLHNAAPYVLGQRDVNTGLFPFMQAACANGEDQALDYSDDEAELDRVETIFELLRALPEVLAGEE